VFGKYCHHFIAHIWRLSTTIRDSVIPKTYHFALGMRCVSVLVYLTHFTVNTYSAPNNFYQENNPTKNYHAVNTVKGTSNNLLGFRENKGQIIDTKGRPRNDIRYVYHGSQFSIYFTLNSVYYVFEKREQQNNSLTVGLNHCDEHKHYSKLKSSYHRIQHRYINANPSVQIVVGVKLPYTERYYTAHCPDGVQVSMFSRITYKNIYKNIDAVYSITPNGIKTEYIVAKGGNPDEIQIQTAGQSNLTLKPNGSLSFISSLGEFTDSKPISYQGSEIIKTRYRIHQDIISYKVNKYDLNKDLIIDPEQTWAYFVGGAGEDQLSRLVVDKDRSIISVGRTASRAFPVRNGAYQSYRGGDYDAVCMKFDPSGTILWATYFGGSQREIELDNHCAVTVDNTGAIIFTGCTNSDDLPVTQSAFQNKRATANYDAMIVKLSSSGAVQWATYCGGNDTDDAFGITNDERNNIYVTGMTASPVFPVVTNAPLLQTLNGRFTGRDAYVMKITPQGSPEWLRFIGGSRDDWGFAIVSDKNGTTYTTGYTQSQDRDFTVGNVEQNFFSGKEDGFVTKINPIGDVEWSTWLGGADVDILYDISIDSSRTRPNVTVCGETRSKNLPRKFPYANDDIVGDEDGFVAQFNDGGTLNWLRYIGGRNTERFKSIATDPDFNIVVTGETNSTNMPILGGFQPQKNEVQDCYIAKISRGGRIEWTSYLGGKQSDIPSEIAVDKSSSIVLCGFTNSSDFPKAGNSHADNDSRTYDGFLTKLCNISIPFADVNKFTYCKGDTRELKIANLNPQYSSFQWVLDGKVITGATSSSHFTSTSLAPGTYKYVCRVANQDGCPASTDTILVTVQNQPTITVPTATICRGESVTIIGITEENGRRFTSIRWTSNQTLLSDPNSSEPVAFPTTTTRFNFTATDSRKCTIDSSILITVIDKPEPVITVRGSTQLCEGDSVFLDAGAGFSQYRWSNSQSSQVVKITSSGDYTVQVFLSGLCTGISTPVKVIVNPLPMPTISQNDKILSTQQFSVYQWVDAQGNAIPGATNQDYEFPVRGTYSVRVVDENGCLNISPPFQATVRGSSVIKIGNGSGEPTNRVRIPLTLVSGSNLDFLSAMDYRVRITYNSTVLKILSASNNVSIIQQRLLPNNRGEFVLEGKRTTASGILTELEFAVALGNEVESAITIEEFNWLIPDNTLIRLQTENGIFSLKGLCMQNGVRLFEDTGTLQLSMIAPQPASNDVTIVFSVIEDGATNLELIDITGNVVQTLLNTSLKAGEYTLKSGLSQIPSGGYILRLRTPNQMISSSCSIVR
jgi:hypothetical protein